jgi:diadenosine tetraphosphate (Ap4A) HIT family hydrolase
VDLRPSGERSLNDDFILDPRLETSSVPVADWPLSQVRLVDDARFHWLLLVPRRAGIVELTDLAAADYETLTAEILAAVRLVQEVARADKTNIASLGNSVPQLHVHVIGRFRSDPAWPGAVWSAGDGPAFPPHALSMLADTYATTAQALAPR